MFYRWQFFAWNICGVLLAIRDCKILAIDMCEIFAYYDKKEKKENDWQHENDYMKLNNFSEKKKKVLTKWTIWYVKNEEEEINLCGLLTHTMNSWWFIESFSAYGTKFSLVMRWFRPTMRYWILYYTWCYAWTRCHNACDTLFMHDEVTHCKNLKRKCFLSDVCQSVDFIV